MPLSADGADIGGHGLYSVDREVPTVASWMSTAAAS